jgi:hypothetical protein
MLSEASTDRTLEDVIERLKKWRLEFENQYDKGYINLDKSFEEYFKIIVSLEALSERQASEHNPPKKDKQ